MAFGMGMWFGDVSQNQTTVEKLASIDDWKNALADSLSLGHDDESSGHLYPVSVLCAASMGSLAGMYNNAFPDPDLMDGLRDRGITPLISWAPTGIPGDRAIATWQNWVEGDYDSGIDRFCRDNRQWCFSDNAQGTNARGEPKSSEIIIRIAQEMNTHFFEWGIGMNGNTISSFKNAWSRIHDRIRLANGCLNVGLLYCPWPNASANQTIAQCFPGADKCEYIGTDIFSTATPSGNWPSVPSLRSILNTPYDDLTALAGNLPIILAECGVEQTGMADADVATWFTGTGWTGTGAAGGIPFVVASKTRVRQLVYFNVIGTGQQFPDSPAKPLTHAAMAVQVDAYHDRVDPAYQSDLRGPRPVIIAF